MPWQAAGPKDEGEVGCEQLQPGPTTSTFSSLAIFSTQRSSARFSSSSESSPIRVLGFNRKGLSDARRVVNLCIIHIQDQPSLRYLPPSLAAVARREPSIVIRQTDARG